MSLSADLAACARLVETSDTDRFAATMAAPPAARARLWPLYALNLELARAPYASPEPLVAEMRLQWWVDQIDGLSAGAPPLGDVATALAPLLAAHPDLAVLLADMAEARRWEVWRAPFADSAALERYIDRTAGHLMWSAARLLGAPANAEIPVRAFASAAGLANWLVAVPELTARGRHPLWDGHPAAIAALARKGLADIAAARRKSALVPAACHPALWAGWPARTRLKQAARHPERVARGLAEPTQLHRSLCLLQRSITGWW